MKTVDVWIVRVYVTESSQLLNKIFSYLKKEIHIRGITVFRAIEGFGDSGERSSSLVDISLNLPIIIEFFDDKDKVGNALTYLSTLVSATHIVFWQAKANAL